MRRHSCRRQPSHGLNTSNDSPSSVGSTRRPLSLPPYNIRRRTVHRSLGDECRGRNTPAPFLAVSLADSPDSPSNRPTYASPGDRGSCAACTAVRRCPSPLDQPTSTENEADCRDGAFFCAPSNVRCGVVWTSRAKSDDRCRRDHCHIISGLFRIRRRSVADRRNARSRV